MSESDLLEKEESIFNDSNVQNRETTLFLTEYSTASCHTTNVPTLSVFCYILK